MSLYKKFFLFSFGGLVFLASGFLYPVFAYEIQDLIDAPITGGFVLGPGKAEIWADPGDEKTKEVYITNRLGKTMNFKVEIEDFRGSRNPEETVVLLGQDRGPYSLKDYIKPEITEFSLMHGQRIYLPVKIQIPLDAEPGGLYGAIIVTTNNPKSELQSEKEKATGQVQIVSRLGSLFFVRVSGDAKEDGLLKDFYIKNSQRFFEKTPINFEILFENNGSVHLIPYATIEIKNMFGKKIDEFQVDPWFVLPDSLRLREIEWNKAPLFGKYTATIGVNRGYNDIIDQKSISFWVIPWKYVAAGLAGLLLLALLLRWIFSSFEIRRKS
jgi:hypothetical protein